MTAINKNFAEEGQTGKKRSLIELKRMLAICDIESGCGEFVRSAAATASRMQTELLVLTVIYDPFGIKGLSFPRPSLSMDYRKLIEKIRSDLREIAIDVRQQGVSIQTMIREGKPLKEILAVIRSEQIDLLVLPAHSETRLEHLLFGRKNKTLLRQMPCSILFLKREPEAVEEEEEEGEEEKEK